MNTANKLLLALLISASALLSGCDRSSAPPKPKVAAAPVQKMSRDEFSKMVMGQNNQVIRAKLGEPELNNNYGGQFGILWVYRNITFDAASGKQDAFATIVFENGVVTKVVFK